MYFPDFEQYQKEQKEFNESIADSKITQQCSNCLKMDITVDRNMFDGMCADCTTLSLYDDKIRDNAKKNNKLLKQNFF